MCNEKKDDNEIEWRGGFVGHIERMEKRKTVKLFPELGDITGWNRKEEHEKED